MVWRFFFGIQTTLVPTTHQIPFSMFSCSVCAQKVDSDTAYSSTGARYEDSQKIFCYMCFNASTPPQTSQSPCTLDSPLSIPEFKLPPLLRMKKRLKLNDTTLCQGEKEDDEQVLPSSNSNGVSITPVWAKRGWPCTPFFADDDSISNCCPCYVQELKPGEERCGVLVRNSADDTLRLIGCYEIFDNLSLGDTMWRMWTPHTKQQLKQYGSTVVSHKTHRLCKFCVEMYLARLQEDKYTNDLCFLHTYVVCENCPTTDHTVKTNKKRSRSRKKSLKNCTRWNCHASCCFDQDGNSSLPPGTSGNEECIKSMVLFCKNCAQTKK